MTTHDAARFLPAKYFEVLSDADTRLRETSRVLQRATDELMPVQRLDEVLGIKEHQAR